MYLPPTITPGETNEGRYFEIGKEYLFTFTGFAESVGTTLSLQFKHGFDDTSRPITSLIDISEDTVVPVSCNGFFRVVTAGSSSEFIYPSAYPIIRQNL